MTTKRPKREMPLTMWRIVEVADSFGISTRHVTRMIEQGHLRSIHIGRRHLIPDEEVARLRKEGVPAMAVVAHRSGEAKKDVPGSVLCRMRNNWGMPVSLTEAICKWAGIEMRLSDKSGMVVSVEDYARLEKGLREINPRQADIRDKHQSILSVVFGDSNS